MNMRKRHQSYGIDQRMKTVMVSGHFDPFHFAHLGYIEQAIELGDQLICLISSDKQVIMKKGKVNEPENERAMLMAQVLKGLHHSYIVLINQWDKDTLVAKALEALRPDIFCRGTDKTIEDMPPEEKAVCEELGIKIIHIQGQVIHGSNFV